MRVKTVTRKRQRLIAPKSDYRGRSVQHMPDGRPVFTSRKKPVVTEKIIELPPDGIYKDGIVHISNNTNETMKYKISPCGYEVIF